VEATAASLLPGQAAISTPTRKLTNTPLPTVTFTPMHTPTQTLIPTATPLGGGYGQIAFASSRAGMPEIFLMNSDGSNQRQITNISDGACQPDWSPDGKQIVFISPCLDRQDMYRGSSLFIINADGSGLTALATTAEGGDFDPAWSPDGKRIAFTSLRDGYPQIYVLNPADGSVTNLTNTSKDREARQPSWSPTGTQIVYTVKRMELSQIWVMSDTGRGQTQLVRSGDENHDFLPVWSPDGQVVLFTQFAGAWKAGWLMSIRYDQRETQNASHIKNGLLALDAEYSPDGLWLVFESPVEGLGGRINDDIFRMTVDGKERTRLTTDPALDFDPAWRPITGP
jgi:Tol biopolymer transport system component